MEVSKVDMIKPGKRMRCGVELVFKMGLGIRLENVLMLATLYSDNR